MERAKAVADAVRSTLGPKGMDKMLVDTMGDVVITNDGVTILKEMDIEHPAAKMMVEIAKIELREIFASSYKYYESHPLGRVVLKNNTDMPMPAAKLYLRLGEMALASFERTWNTVSSRKIRAVTPSK